MKEKTKEVVVGSTDWLNTLDDGAVLRERELLRSAKNPHGLLPMSRSRWWSGVASGAHPAPVRLGPKITGWRASDIRDWLSTQLELSSNQTGALRLGPKRLKTLKATAAQKGFELTLVRRADSGSYLFLLAGAGATYVLATPAEVETHLSACPVQEGVTK